MPLITLKLGSAVNMPDRRMRDILTLCALQSNRSATAAARRWQRWHEDAPEYVDTAPSAWWDSPVGKAVYRAACDAAPELSTNIVSSLVQRVRSLLGKRQRWKERTIHKTTWRAVLANDERLPFFCNETFPIPRKNARFCWLGKLDRPDSGTMTDRLQRASTSQALLYVPLLSKQATCGMRSLLARVEVRQLTNGQKRILRNITDDEQPDWTMRDSLLTCRDGQWLFRMTYAQPEISLNADTTIEVWPSLPDQRNPMYCRLPGGQRSYFGDGGILVFETARGIGRSKSLAWKYRYGAGAGHGKQRYFSKQRPIARRQRSIADMNLKKCVSHVIRVCERNEAGTVSFRRPSEWIKRNDWYRGKGISFAWVDFEARLAAKCETKGIAFVYEILKKAEWMPE